MPSHVDTPRAPTPAADSAWQVVAPRRRRDVAAFRGAPAPRAARPRGEVGGQPPPPRVLGVAPAAGLPQAWLQAAPEAPSTRPVPAAPSHASGRLDFGPLPADWPQLRALAPSAISEAVKRLQRDGRGREARAVAHAALQRHPRDAHLWAQLLQACRDELGTVEALRAQMARVGAPLDTYHDAAFLNAAGRAGDALRAEDFAAAAYAGGRDLNVSGYNALMLAYVRAGRPDDAFAVLDDMAEAEVAPNEVTPAQLATAARAAARPDLVAVVVRALEDGELWTDAAGYNAVAAAARDVDAPDLLARAFAAAETAGVQPSAAMYNVSIDLHARRGEPQAAQQVFVALLAAQVRPTEATFLALLGAHRADQNSAAIGAALAAMPRHGLTPDVRHLSAALQGLGAARDTAGVRALWAQLRARKFVPDVQGFAAALTAFGSCDADKEAWVVYRELRAAGCRPNAVVLNVLVDCLARGRLGAEAETLLAEMRTHKFVGGAQAYTLLVDLFGRTDRQACIPRVFAAMAEAGVRAPEATYTAVIAAAGALGALTTVQSAWMALQAAGHAPSARTVIALCHAYHKAGRRDRNRYGDGAALLRGLDLPLEVLPDVADLLRKARERSAARALCRRVMDALPSNDANHHHAWMVDIYCTETNDASARRALARPPFGVDSPQWVRYLCATVFWDAVQLPAQELQKTLCEARAKPRNEGSLEDISQALLALSRGAKAV